MYVLEIACLICENKSGAYRILKYICSIAFLMNLKDNFFVCVKFGSGPPVSFKYSERHVTQGNGFLSLQKIWRTYSSNTNQTYLRYKIEVNFLKKIESQLSPYFL